MIDPKIDGRVALVTGANHGIGAATALALADQGARILIAFHRDVCQYVPEELEEARRSGVGGRRLYEAMQQQSGDVVAEAIRTRGGDAVSCDADLADARGIPRLFELCEERLGPVDILVSNHTTCILETFDPARAGDGEFPVALVSAPVADAHFAVNARGYALLMAEYVRRFLGRGASWGRIVNLSTDAAHAHVANVSYAASKHAIESYSRSAAAELGRYGITVNIVAPGPIQTGYITPEGEAGIASGTPLGRVGRPEDVAEVIVFLASEQAHWLTGQLLYVGGGWRMGQ
jgi:3-oxoacyl-[acyl-carrier protein] reductase